MAQYSNFRRTGTNLKTAGVSPQVAWYRFATMVDGTTAGRFPLAGGKCPSSTFAPSFTPCVGARRRPRRAGAWKNTPNPDRRFQPGNLPQHFAEHPPSYACEVGVGVDRCSLVRASRCLFRDRTLSAKWPDCPFGLLRYVCKYAFHFARLARTLCLSVWPSLAVEQEHIRKTAYKKRKQRQEAYAGAGYKAPKRKGGAEEIEKATAKARGVHGCNTRDNGSRAGGAAQKETTMREWDVVRGTQQRDATPYMTRGERGRLPAASKRSLQATAGTLERGLRALLTMGCYPHIQATLHNVSH